MDRYDAIISKLDHLSNFEMNLNQYLSRCRLLEEKLNELKQTEDNMEIFRQKMNEVQKSLMSITKI